MRNELSILLEPLWNKKQIIIMVGADHRQIRHSREDAKISTSASTQRIAFCELLLWWALPSGRICIVPMQTLYTSQTAPETAIKYKTMLTGATSASADHANRWRQVQDLPKTAGSGTPAAAHDRSYLLAFHTQSLDKPTANAKQAIRLEVDSLHRKTFPPACCHDPQSNIPTSGKQRYKNPS
jgi:hypothetical protein